MEPYSVIAYPIIPFIITRVSNISFVVNLIIEGTYFFEFFLAVLSTIYCPPCNKSNSDIHPAFCGQILVSAATYTQDPVTGAYTANPGVAVLTVTGTI